MKKVLFVPDCHHPYVDATAWGIMLKAARGLRPDVIVVLGDFLDCYAVSAHSKDPERMQLLEDELDEARVSLDQLDALGAKERIYIAGNHEHRLYRYLCDRAPALVTAVSIPKLLNLRQRGWQYVPYRKTYRLGKLRITHDLGKSGQNAARQAMGTFRHSAVIGHCHRLEMSVLGNPEEGGSPAVGVSFGWLGSVDAVDYIHEAEARASWVHGFGVGYMLDNGVVHIQPIPIVNGQCVVNGVLIK